MILAQLDAMPEAERKANLELLQDGVDAYEAQDREKFRATMTAAGYGDFADIVWEQLAVWLSQ